MKEHIAHSGAWGLALIVIVAASWFFYRYFAPKNWCERAQGFGMYWSSVYEHFTWRRGGEPLTADGDNRSLVVP